MKTVIEYRGDAQIDDPLLFGDHYEVIRTDGARVLLRVGGGMGVWVYCTECVDAGTGCRCDTCEATEGGAA